MENRGNQLREPFHVFLDQRVNRRLYYEYPATLGRERVTAWYIPDDDTGRADRVFKRVIPELLHGRQFNYLLRYRGWATYNDEVYYLFDGYWSELGNIPNLANIEIVVMQIENNVHYPFLLGRFPKLVLSSVAKALMEAKVRGKCHGAVCVQNVVIQLNNLNELSAVKLKGIIRTRDRTSWRQDFLDFGLIVNFLLQDYEDSYPEARDFMARFSGAYGNTKLEIAFKIDPTRIKHHPIWWTADIGLTFICRLADWMDGYRLKEGVIPISQLDYQLYDAILNINMGGWHHGLPGEILATLDEGYEYNSAVDFLRFARNHHLHSARHPNTNPNHFRDTFGVTPEEYYRTFRGRNLAFVIQAYNAVENFFDTEVGAIVGPQFFDHLLILPGYMLREE